MQFHFLLFPFDSIQISMVTAKLVENHTQFLCQDLTTGQPSRLDLSAEAAAECCADAAVSKM